jgi:mRNA interferase HicA
MRRPGRAVRPLEADVLSSGSWGIRSSTNARKPGRRPPRSPIQPKIFESGKGGHLIVRLGTAMSVLPMHGKQKELGTGLVNSIKKDLGLK